MDPIMAELNELLVGTYGAIVKVEAVMLRDLSGERLTIAEMHMLECIGPDRVNGRTVTDIAQKLDITPPSATMAIKRLEKKGYVTKDRCPQDARRVHVRLTKEGHRAEIAHRYFHRQMLRALTGTMDLDEREALLRGVRKLHAFLRERIGAARDGQSEGSEGT